MRDVSMSSKEDLLKIYTMECIIQEAKRRMCNVVIFGDNANVMAMRVFSNTSKGRGISLADDVSFSFIRKDGIQVLRPIREILAKEIGLYNTFQNLESFSNSNLTTGMDKKVSIDRMTADFITGLQDQFPATVSTIIKTAYKIESNHSEVTKVCALCSGYEKFINCRPVDFQSGFSKVGGVVRDGAELSGIVCYACKNIAKELEKGEDLSVPVSVRDRMKESIKDFLIDPDEE